MPARWNEYIYSGNKKLRLGYTTGTCAAAGTAACLKMIFEKEIPDVIMFTVPAGKTIPIEIRDSVFSADSASCSVIKDGGDDIDATDGLSIVTQIRLTNKNIKIMGGPGVGTVTKNGLGIPIGEAAINKIPKQMIMNSVKDAFSKYSYTGGAEITISVPGGEKAAEKTFNSNLGIEGGISILGTTGIVEPMSEKAVIESIKAEINVVYNEFGKFIAMTPGNYGETYIRNKTDIPVYKTVKISNFVGEAIDHSVAIGIKGILLIGHIGKFVKLAGGVMNTHSRYADCRFEIMTACAALCGADIKLLRDINSCITADEALEYIFNSEIRKDFLNMLSDKTNKMLNRRAGTEINIGAIVYSEKYGELYKTEKAGILSDIIRRTDG